MMAIKIILVVLVTALAATGAVAALGAYRWAKGTRGLRARLEEARVPVRVHDAYVAGEGILHAAVLGLFTVAELGGSREVAEGEFMRFVAEAAWYPSALLPSQGVRWEAVDAHSAKATLSDESTALTMLFTFGADGMIETVRAEARARAVGKEFVPSPWQGRFWNYAERAGMRVPLDGEVAWLLPAGAKPYWRGRITDMAYEFAQ